MSWAEVKKINSDLTKALDTLIKEQILVVQNSVNASVGAQRLKVFTANGSWTCPAGVYWVKLTGIAAGGSGGAAYSDSTAANGAGGGWRWLRPVGERHAGAGNTGEQLRRHRG